MSPEQAVPEFLRRSEELYQAAEALPSGERAAFLELACKGNDALKREVESLLAARDRAAHFLESPALEVAARLYGGRWRAVRIGQQIGRYRIVEAVGAGGMGEVYRAEDPLLERVVAVKILPPHLSEDAAALTRFKREAKAVASLSHPNIVALHDFDCDGAVHFAVMELLEGESLAARLKRGSMSWRDAVETAAAVADGLAAAHKRGIVHRDIKPDNIFLTGDGQVKILDFGVASRVTGSHSATQTQATLPGLAVGTVGYMAPEQLRGEAADAPADLFSLGCVLYEMVTGQKAFERSAAVDTVAAVLTSEPPPMEDAAPGIPPALETLTRRCLCKRAGERFASAGDLAFGLRHLLDGTATAHQTRKVPRPAIWTAAIALLAAVSAPLGLMWRQPAHVQESLVILPIVNQNGDAALDSISDGLTDDAIDKLSRLPGLKVIARTTAFRYKGRSVDSRAAGKELKVARVLSSKLIAQGNTPSLEVELLNVSDGARLWSERYPANDSSLSALPETIATRVAGSLRLQLNSADRQKLGSRSTQNQEAYRLYLQGRYYWDRRDWNDRGAVRKAIDAFQQAIDKDPLYALAYVGLADAYEVLAAYSEVPAREATLKAKAAVQRALEIDGDIAEAYATLASIHIDEWEWPEAEKAFRRSLELNPGYAVAHGWYAECLDFTGRTREALAEARRAYELDPLSPHAAMVLGSFLYDDRQYDRAIEQQRRTLELNPDSGMAYVHIALAMFMQRRFAEGLVELDNAEARMKGSPTVMALRGYAYARTGKRAEALEILRRTLASPPSPYATALDLPALYVGLGDPDRAFEALNRSCDVRQRLIQEVKVDPLFDPLRSDPRYAALLRRLNLTP
jgi:serine/threonine protein kinase/Tfp pilus assembly protein PilF